MSSADKHILLSENMKKQLPEGSCVDIQPVCFEAAYLPLEEEVCHPPYTSCEIRLDSLPEISNENLDEELVGFIEQMFREQPSMPLLVFMKIGGNKFKFINDHKANLETIVAARRAGLTHINAYYAVCPNTVWGIIVKGLTTTAFDVT
ncbi:MAG: hypothetical protein DELT_01698 [Desulfovibrio sp.]